MYIGSILYEGLEYSQSLMYPGVPGSNLIQIAKDVRVLILEPRKLRLRQFQRSALVPARHQGSGIPSQFSSIAN